jgi:hypothetical protein
MWKSGERPSRESRGNCNKIDSVDKSSRIGKTCRSDRSGKIGKISGSNRSGRFENLIFNI